MSKQSVHNHSLRAAFALCFGILCVGFAAVFVKIADVTGSVSAFYRVLIASIIVVPWWLATKSKTKLSTNDVAVVMTGGIIFALTLALWNTSVLLTSAATATLLVNSTPIWVGLASFALFRERLSNYYWIGLAVAMGGMMWLLGAEAYKELRLSPGNLLAIGSSISYAAYLITTQRTRDRVDLVAFMALSLLSSMVILLIFNLTIDAKLTGYSNRSWMALIGLGLVSQLGGWLSINYALGHLRAAQVSVWLLSESVVTAVIAMIFLNEYIKINQLIGGALILVGIYFVTKKNGSQNIPVKKANV